MSRNKRKHKIMLEIGRFYRVLDGSPGGHPGRIYKIDDEDKVFYMLMDYSLPEYRDFSLGLFLAEALKKEGFTKMIYDGPAEHHMDYLNKMAFVEDNGVYVKRL